MKIVIAPQGFKGSLSAREVADAMARGIQHVLVNASMVLVPMADGGEGTVDALVSATRGRFITSEVTGPLGEKVVATWGILGDKSTAIIEMAAASGITLVPPDILNPMIATTYGTGELIRAALDEGCRKLIIGIGGSATNDGGAGMAQALGVRFLDDGGNELPRGGAALDRLKQIDVSGLDTRLAVCKVTVACDVTNPLCGVQGASLVYGPQKGATKDMCQQLDKALANYATVIKQELGIDITDMPGGGAAGGLGAGLVAFLSAELMPGIDIICEATRLSRHLEGAALVFTGEGRIDTQTIFGKTVTGVAARAKVSGVPVVAIAGELAITNEELNQYGIDAALSISPGPISLEESSTNASGLITNTTERALRLILITLEKQSSNGDS
ncbi:MAG: glycerate kinase [Dehalococcoidales bacterium]|nr:MAG: glycerate kinase [Dehalococcoidales bacterium]